MARKDIGGAIAIGGAFVLFAGGIAALHSWADRLDPEPTPVNLPVVYPDASAMEHPVQRVTTACPTPAQKEVAFGDLPEPARLPHPDAEVVADPGPPVGEVPTTPREAMVLFRRAQLRLDGARDDMARLAKAIEAVAGEGVKP